MTNSTDSHPHQDSTTPHQWSSTIWAGVSADMSCYVIILADDFEILFMNSAAAAWLHHQWPNSDSRLYLHDVLPQPIAHERCELVREAMSNGETKVMDGIIAGEGLRCKIRRLPDDDFNRHCALLIFRPLERLHQFQPEDGVTPVVAEENDLGPLSRLTPRETEVLALVAQGLSSDEAAFQLQRSRRTIDCHRAAISQKLNAHSIAELAVIAFRAGLVRFAPGDAKHTGRLVPILASDLLHRIVHPKDFRARQRTAAGSAK